MKLVPRFQEKEVDKYFQYFEKIATNLKWPKEHWTMLLQSSFVGKAREIYASLPIEKCNNYDEVKQAILKAYELVPEAYRQKFRNSRQQADQTHVEFARVKEQMFDRWLGSKEIKDDFGQLRQLVMVEEFKGCVHADIKTHLDENATKIKTLHEAAVMADDYGLTHKLNSTKFSQNRSYSYKPSHHKPSHGNHATHGNYEKKSQSHSNQSEKSKGSFGGSESKPKHSGFFKSPITCNHCKITRSYDDPVLCLIPGLKSQR